MEVFIKESTPNLENKIQAVQKQYWKESRWAWFLTLLYLATLASFPFIPAIPLITATYVTAAQYIIASCALFGLLAYEYRFFATLKMPGGDHKWIVNLNYLKTDENVYAQSVNQDGELLVTSEQLKTLLGYKIQDLPITLIVHGEGQIFLEALYLDSLHKSGKADGFRGSQENSSKKNCQLF